MTVTQVHEALGSFEFELLGNVPREVLDTIQHFSHVAIIPGRLDPRQYGDGLLSAARYVGVVRRIKNADDGRTNLIQDDIRISGVGTEFWLGDDDNKGYVIESLTDFTSASFNTVMGALRPASVNNGTIYTVTGSYSGRHQYETPRSAIQYVCQTMSTEAIPVGYRVTNDIKLNAGPESSLFVTTPQCIIMRKGSVQGEDMFMRALPSTLDMDEDMEDFATRVVMLAESDGDTFATGTADIGTISPGTNVYKDINGNALVLTKLVSESDTIVENADTRAELALRSVLDPHRSLTLAADDYDIHGTFEVGDYIYVYDPDAALVDNANEVQIRGVRVNPIKLRVTEADWPVTEGYTVAHRDADGNWMDLTDYIHFEEEQTSRVVVGDYNRDLTQPNDVISSRTGAITPVDNSTPAAPTWVTPFTTVTYLDGNGLSSGAVIATWNTPLNTDGSAVSDGDRYELNARISGTTDWTAYNVAWGTNAFRFNELSVATTYEFRVRGIDRGNNIGAWSSTQSQLVASDSTAPSQPAAPTVAASTIAVQVKHTLGKQSGGTYNLEADLADFEVHISTVNNFTPSGTGTYIGSMRANKGMMAAGVPAVETFDVSDTTIVYIKLIAVDTSGNKSTPSPQATVTATLVDSAHISDLTATKITTGTLSANILLGASIRTAASGARVELNQNGLQAYASGGGQTVSIDAATGSVTIQGQIISGTAGKRMEINPTSTLLPEIRFYPSTGTNYGYVNSYTTSVDVNMGINSSTFTNNSTTVLGRSIVAATSSLEIVRLDTQARHGGYVWVSSDNTFLGFNRGGVDGGMLVATAASMKVGYDDGTAANDNYFEMESTQTRHIGLWRDFVSVDSNEGIITGTVDAPSDAGSLAISYGPTMLSAPVPIVSVRDNVVHQNAVTAASTTSFTVTLSPVGSGVWSVYYWAFRM